MHSKLEIEYKVLITRDELYVLLEQYPHHKTINQTNTYFDTTPSLKNKGMGCRIRQIENQFIFTLKIKQGNGHKEIEVDIDSNDIQHPAIREIRHTYDIGCLAQVGELHTIRHLVDLETAELCIDENHYNNIIDYEVEYELKDSSLDTFSDFLTILNKANISYVPNKQSKIQRCLQSKKSE